MYHRAGVLFGPQVLAQLCPRAMDSKLASQCLLLVSLVQARIEKQRQWIAALRPVLLVPPAPCHSRQKYRAKGISRCLLERALEERYL
eukprot:CAMPEP_0202049374 /NCGR_PEP_ID=MMETSP0963-20130614/3333_1 /ASSEMBLY_ACC=CAM_ASM_000494 /TAXON_ID=4773 /ORGANISM="Schizochytrium aggregatum, Strain ATCC28209" /LENGTH=87 /DNA_ID=CAMNT_0048614377 /DNA_START=8 /DNA_END=268 /DNA_ORIENTATION=-